MSDAEDAEEDQRTIEVDDRVYRRFEQRRKATKNEHVPAMEESLFLSSLLDTEEAVRRGYYGDE
jgi:hypothetical protein